MSLKVEASRFAVLNIDDDDSGNKKKQKTLFNNQNNQNNIKNQTKNVNQIGKSASQPLVKSNVKKAKKSAIEKNALNNLNQVKNSSSIENNGQTVRLSKKNENSIDNQWEQWKEMDEKFVEKEFQQQLKQVVEESKNTADKQSNCENNKRDKVKEGFKNVLPENVVQPPQLKAKKAKNKNVEKLNDTLTNLSFEEQFEIKNQSIIEIQKIIENVQIEIGDYKSENQKLCKYLLQGEVSNVKDMENEISELREKHKLQTLKLIQLSTELEKERSKGHFLKSELNKIKTHKDVSTK